LRNLAALPVAYTLAISIDMAAIRPVSGAISAASQLSDIDLIIYEFLIRLPTDDNYIEIITDLGAQITTPKLEIESI
jgi:hypothetical protein